MTKQVLEGWTVRDFKPVWTLWNYINFGAVIQKNRYEAEIRYDCELQKNRFKKIRITIEELND